ncbi:sarcosine oxidase subunit gamma [Shimia sp.]|uniref:sarcosine oxidase subunit gamma n=1 Tax=Shimia sp. TaxID=1954381 RepID=UPI003299ADE8
MAELIAKSPCDGMLPLEIGQTVLSEVPMSVMTSLAARRGKEAALAGALKAAHEMALPGVNRATGKDGARAIWFGQGQVMLIGPEPDARLADHAALSDQSDAWAVVKLEGSDAEAVLARLVPLDLRQVTFKRGHSARTMLQHMTISITRIGDASFQIMTFRSMAKTLVHELETAMKGVAARASS